jgi:hypothetical protein
MNPGLRNTATTHADAGLGKPPTKEASSGVTIEGDELILMNGRGLDKSWNIARPGSLAHFCEKRARSLPLMMT